MKDKLAVKVYRANEFKYEEATDEQWERFMERKKEPIAIIFYKALKAYNEPRDKAFLAKKNHNYQLSSYGMNIPL